MKFLSFLLMFKLLMTSCGATQKGYEQGSQYGAQGVPLGDPSTVDTGFLHRGESVSHLTRLNDTSLAGQGKKSGEGLDALQTDAGENLLLLSERGKLDAFHEHKINPQNSFFQNSLEIENNPLEETGGQENGQRSVVTKETQEFCEEGVQFEVDVVRQLVYEPKIVREDYWTDFKVTTLNIPGQTMWRIDLKNRPGRYYGWCQSAPKVADGMFLGRIWDGPGQQSYLCTKLSQHLGIPQENFGQINTKNEGGPVKCYGRGGKDYMRSNYRFDYETRERKTRVYDAGGEEYWTVLTPDTEVLIEEHNCYEIARACVDSGNKDFEGIVVNRDCWREQITYVCRTEPLKGCQYLEKKGCRLENSICVDDSLYPCSKWRRQYKCVREEERMSPGIKGSGIFCLGGDCFTPKIGQNTDLNQAVAYLSVFKEIQEDMKNQEPPTFFKGEGLGCGRHLADFTNCCSSMAGWGIGLGLSRCSANEKMLAKKKKKGLCHYVGTYCSNKMPVTGICLTKKSVYCCFGSKLSRLFHEQGRAQLGRGWGRAKCPDCGPFTSFDLQNINFENMDFSELFHDLFKGLDSRALKAFPSQMANQMPVSQAKLEAMRKKRLPTGGPPVEKMVF